MQNYLHFTHFMSYICTYKDIFLLLKIKNYLSSTHNVFAP